MTIFGPLKDATVTVARLSGRDVSGDPTYGTQQEIDVRLHEGADIERGDEGTSVDQIDKLTTDEYEFAETDAIWLPGADTTETTESVTPIEVGQSTIGNVILSQAVL